MQDRQALASLGLDGLNHFSGLWATGVVPLLFGTWP